MGGRLPKRWQHDKIVRSTHGVNCTGSCSWKIYVKGGIVTWETQQTDYPRTRPDLPNHEPRGCARGASYSWYLYRQPREVSDGAGPPAQELARGPRNADPGRRLGLHRREPQKRASTPAARPRRPRPFHLGRSQRDHRVRQCLYDQEIWPRPRHRLLADPAMSMVSYAAGSRYLRLIGGVCLSFYDWYCDLPPGSPQTWGEQTDVPETADWYNARYHDLGLQRTADAHAGCAFLHRGPLQGHQERVVSPDYAEAAKFADIWLHPKQGTDAGVALAMGHVILKEYYFERKRPISTDYAGATPTCQCWCAWSHKGETIVPERLCERKNSTATGQANNAGVENGRIRPWTISRSCRSAPSASAGGRRANGTWKPSEGFGGAREAQVSLEATIQIARVSFPYFGGVATNGFKPTDHADVLTRNVPVRTSDAKDGDNAGHHGVRPAVRQLRRGPWPGWRQRRERYDEDKPYTPAWQEPSPVCRASTSSCRARVCQNAEKTQGRSMVILGAGLNHWYHMDMAYRGIINMLVICGCIGQSGGGWSHYVGQEKLRPQTGWAPIAFATRLGKPPRHMNGTSSSMRIPTSGATKR